MNSNPKPYPFAEGAMAMRYRDVPQGWEIRTSPIGAWFVPSSDAQKRSQSIVEARPRKPATVTVPIEDVRTTDYLPDGRKVKEVTHRGNYAAVHIEIDGVLVAAHWDAYGTPVEIRERKP